MFIQNNNVFKIGSFTGNYDKLPVGTYRLAQDNRTGEFYLIKTEDFKIPHKLYGETKHISRILNSFNNSNKNLGVLLAGTKGTGKSIDAKRICLQSNLPVIIIDQCFEDTNLLNFFSAPELGSCVVLIDEYEKLYVHEQTIILQLLDGAINSRHLFILTVNEIYGINNNLINRPSRIFYRKLYSGLTSPIIKEVLNIELLNSKWESEMLEVLDKFSEVTFDILMSLIKEVNMYNESPLECAKLMNFELDQIRVNVIQIFKDGIEARSGDTTLFNGESTLEVYALETPNTHSGCWKNLDYNLLKRINKDTWIYKDDEYYFRFIRVKTVKSLF